jgi:hypothetical protein
VSSFQSPGCEPGPRCPRHGDDCPLRTVPPERWDVSQKPSVFRARELAARIARVDVSHSATRQLVFFGQLISDSGEFTIQGALEAVRAWHERGLRDLAFYLDSGDSAEAEALWRRLSDPNQSAVMTIYGSGGWSRYPVTPDGIVWFSARHSDPLGILRAEREGFPIWR